MVSATGEMIDDDPSHQGSLGMTENRSSEVLIAVDISTTNSSRSESLQISSSENYICNDEVNILQKSTTRTKPKPKKKSCLRCYVSSLAHTLLCVFVVFFLLIFFWEINSLFLDMEARRPDRMGGCFQTKPKENVFAKSERQRCHRRPAPSHTCATS